VKRLSRAKEGFGIDRHLYALYNLAKQQLQQISGYKLPEIFTDPAYSILRHDFLSTSNCGGYALSLFGFGAVVQDGFGIGYIIKDSCMHFNVTSFDSTKTSKFMYLLEQSLLEMGQLLANKIPVRAIRRAKI